MEKHSVTLPDAVQGWHLLRKANLTKEQCQLVTLRAPQLERKKVVEALYLILGQDYRATHGAHGKPFHKGYKFRGYAAQDYDPDELYDDGASEWQSEWADDGAYYKADDAEEAEEWHEPDAFDSSAVYYQYDGDDGTMDEAPWHDVESYDQAYATYLDARKRFSDLRLQLARGCLPVVAVGDPSAGNISPGVTSPGSSPTSKGKKGKSKGSSKGGSPKGKPATYKYSPAPMKAAEPKARAKAALRCLRCGQPGHFAANCPVFEDWRQAPCSSNGVRCPA